MISVCVATYNGEKYLAEQIESILSQLAPEDEVIVSDDGSTDRTRDIVLEWMAKDARVVLHEGPKRGIVANFAHAIAQANGTIIFLADQDDVWLPNKVQVICAYFNARPSTQVVISDLKIVDATLQEWSPSYFAYRKVKNGFLNNLMRNGYIGAGMAFRGELKEKILPIPPQVPMHDMWIGLIGEWRHQTVFLREVLTLYRRHGQNASDIVTKTSFLKKLRWRFHLSVALIKRLLLHSS